MHHDLKIETPYFEAILQGKKTFEIRFNDRGYNAGDTVVFKEIHDFHKGYTGREICSDIGYVSNHQQKEGFVVFSLIGVELAP